MKWPWRRPTPVPPPNPVDLWVQADGDPDLYARLLADAGLDRPVRDPRNMTREESQ